jgi:hypothetical protein
MHLHYLTAGYARSSSQSTPRSVRKYDIDAADLMPPVYQTFGKWLRCSTIEFSDTSGTPVPTPIELAPRE